MKRITVVTKVGSYIGMWPDGNVDISSTRNDGQVSFDLAGQTINMSNIKSIEVDTF